MFLLKKFKSDSILNSPEKDSFQYGYNESKLYTNIYLYQVFANMIFPSACVVYCNA